MDRFLPLLSFLLLSAAAAAAAASHAPLPAQVYWHTVIPDTPMPSAIRELLRPADALTDEKTSVYVGKGGVNVHAGKGGGTNVNVGHKGVGVNVQHGGKGTTVGVGGAAGGVHVSTHKPGGGGTTVNVGHGVSVNTGHRGKPPVVVVVPYSPFLYRYAATETQIHSDPNVALFFLDKDLRSGNKMTLTFPGSASGSAAAAFLPRRAAESMPFSSEKLPDILSRFSVETGSFEAEAMKQTIHECEEPAMDGEKKYCATSLESMVDFATTSLGTRHVRAVSTEAGKGGAKLQQYTVGRSERLPGNELVACHRQAYAYPVFYCHVTGATRAYAVELTGASDGEVVEAVAVCHVDTAGWNPGHLAFKVLKVKPGSVPVCHFLPRDHVVWGPK